MSPFAALFLYPLWSLTLVMGFTALRLARRTGWGLLLLCWLQAAWVTSLILLESGAVTWAERLLPSGMLLAGAFAHAAADMAGLERRTPVWIAWSFSALVALVGLVAPRLLYGPGAVGPGPIFWPLAGLSIAATGVLQTWLWRFVRAAPSPRERRRRAALHLANLSGALGGGFAIALHITGLAPSGIAAPFLLASILTAGFAVLASERGRDRELLEQGLVLALVTAGLSAFGLLGFFAALPALVPGADPFTPWGLMVVFLAALPLEPLRSLVVERALGAFFARPIAVRALAREAEAQADRAEHAEQLAEIGRIAGGVAHEVRNPLGIILAEAKLLERSGADPESVAAIRAQVARSERFVGELLRFAKPRPHEPVEVELCALVREAATHAASGLEGASGRLHLPHAEDLWVEADPTGLSEVLRNLIANALIATEGEEDRRVQVTLEPTRDHHRIVIEDDGPGVPEALEPRLFQAFATGRGRDARHPGTGLGLALSQRLMQRHGGHITHQRRPGGGARFIVEWPR